MRNEPVVATDYVYECFTEGLIGYDKGFGFYPKCHLKLFSNLNYIYHVIHIKCIGEYQEKSKVNEYLGIYCSRPNKTWWCFILRCDEGDEV